MYRAETVLAALVVFVIAAVILINPFSPPVEYTMAPDAAAAGLPPGYQLSRIVEGLQDPAALSVDEHGNIFVAEHVPGRVVMVKGQNLVAINGGGDALLVKDGRALVARAGGIYSTNAAPGAGDGTMLVKDVPSFGDYGIGDLCIDGEWLYFSVGTATNSGIVGADNILGGWVGRNRTGHDLATRDIRVTGLKVKTDNLLTPDPNDGAFTTGWRAFNDPATGPASVSASPIGNGAIYRVKLAGGQPEMVADGIHTGSGLFKVGDTIYFLDRGMEDRGSRPIANAPDTLYRLEPQKWYGWPDFAAGESVQKEKFQPKYRSNPPALLLQQPPMTPPLPDAVLGVGLGVRAAAVIPPSFGLGGKVVVAADGSEFKTVRDRDGYRGEGLYLLDPKDGSLKVLAQANISNDSEGTMIVRPVDVTFSPDGSKMYVLDAGPRRVPGAQGVIWEISRGASGGHDLRIGILIAGVVLLAGLVLMFVLIQRRNR
jgi:glucose/arabinose dehydrogenase